MFKALLTLFRGVENGQTKPPDVPQKTGQKTNSGKQNSRVRVTQLVQARKAENTPLMEIYREINQLSENTSENRDRFIYC